MKEGLTFTPSVSEQARTSTFGARTLFEPRNQAPRLTTEAPRPYAKSEVLFMIDNGPSASEVLGGFRPAVEAARPMETQPPQDPILKIRDVQARNFARNQQERIDVKPLDRWNNEELKDAYRGEIVFGRQRRQELERELDGRDQHEVFAAVEGLASDLQQYGSSVFGELLRRQENQMEREDAGEKIPETELIDLVQIGIEAAQELEEKGLKGEGGGPGAANRGGTDENQTGNRQRGTESADAFARTVTEDLDLGNYEPGNRGHYFASRLKKLGEDGKLTEKSLREERDRINAETEEGIIDPSDQAKLLDDIQLIQIKQIMALRGVTAEEAADMLNSFMGRPRLRGERTRLDARTKESYRLSLLDDRDMDELLTNPIGWLDQQFDLLYMNVRENQELDSPFMQSLMQSFSTGSRFLSKYNRADAEEFTRHFNSRINMIKLRSVMGGRSIEQVQSAASQVGMHGLLYSMSIEENLVGDIAGRLHEALDDMRLKQQRKNVTNDLIYKLQGDVIEEQFQLTQRGVGKFGSLDEERFQQSIISSSGRPYTYFELAKMSDKEFQRATTDEHGRAIISQDERATITEVYNTYAKITRVVRSAYDVLVGSQRQAVIAARGKRELSPTKVYRTDPIGPLKIYNEEEFNYEKWGIVTADQRQYVDAIKLDMANDWVEAQREQGINVSLTREQMLELGTRKFRDFIAPPDILSSGWRIEAILDSMQSRFRDRFQETEGKNARGQTAEDFALFFRLKTASRKHIIEEEDHHTHKKVRKEVVPEADAIWQKIAQYRPEEVLKLFRERAKDEGSFRSLVEDELFDSLDEPGKGKGTPQSARDERTLAEYRYDRFKEEYGKVIQMVRRRGYQKFEQLDLSQGFGEYTEDVAKALAPKDNGSMDLEQGRLRAAQLVEMFRRIKGFASDQKTRDMLIDDYRFTDTYFRTLVVDDAFLEELEKTELTYVDEDGNKKTVGKYVPLSQQLSTEAGGDGLRRMWNDTKVADEAGEKLLNGVIRVEAMEKRYTAAEDVAELSSAYNGPDGRINVLKYTMGTDIKLRRIPAWADALGIKELPMRGILTQIEKIYGPQAENLDMEATMHILDEYRNKLIKQARVVELTEDQKTRHDANGKPLFDPQTGNRLYLSQEEQERLLEQERHHQIESVESSWFGLRDELRASPKHFVQRRMLVIMLLLLTFGGAEIVRIMDFGGGVKKLAA